MVPLIGSLIGAGASLLGGLFGRKSNEDANRQNVQAQLLINQQNREQAERLNALALADKERDRELQREFAQSGIKWRVDDALAAGVHPLFALGGSGASYAPSSVAFASAPGAAPQVKADASLPASLSNMGQDLSRAFNATRTAVQRDLAFSSTVQGLQLSNFQLQNELLSAQIAKLRASTNPPMPSSVGPVPQAAQFEDRPRLMTGSTWATDPQWTNAEDFETRYGEMSDWVFGPQIMWNDYKANYGVQQISPLRRGVENFVDRIERSGAYNRGAREGWRGHY